MKPRQDLTRRSTISGLAVIGLAGAGLAATVAPAHATRDTALETYVLESVRTALAAVTNPSLTARARQTAFADQMRRFADLERLAINVLGRYGASMMQDTTRARRWIGVFTAYSTAVYEDQFTQFQTDTFTVTGSRVTRANADAIVNSQITRRGAARASNIDWRLMRTGSNPWRVMDIRMVFDGSEVWLSESQTTDFIALIERNNRDLDRFIAAVEDLTTRIQARIADRA